VSAPGALPQSRPQSRPQSARKAPAKLFFFFSIVSQYLEFCPQSARKAFFFASTFFLGFVAGLLARLFGRRLVESRAAGSAGATRAAASRNRRWTCVGRGAQRLFVGAAIAAVLTRAASKLPSRSCPKSRGRSPRPLRGRAPKVARASASVSVASLPLPCLRHDDLLFFKGTMINVIQEPMISFESRTKTYSETNEFFASSPPNHLTKKQCFHCKTPPQL
jgi:hypothetical protein